MARGFVIGARVFGIEGLDGVAAFDADWHCKDLSVSSEHCGPDIKMAWAKFARGSEDASQCRSLPATR
jgi:hypothetical protein